MSFYRDKKEDFFLQDTAVENIFIHEFMAAAPDKYVKVYLLALMYTDLGASLSTDDIARHLEMEHEDVLKAWTYWEKAGVIRKHPSQSGGRFDYDVEFITLRQQMYGQAVSAPAESGGQIGTMMSDPEIKDMISEIEKTAGRVFNSSEIREIFSWIDDYQMLPETIAYAFAYCTKRKKTDTRYVGTVVHGWADLGLRDVASVQEHLSKIDRQHTLYRRVFRALGFSRNATEEEKHIMDRWFGEMGFSMETVLDACKKTAGISSPNINYVNAILTRWSREGVPDRAKDPDAPKQKELAQYYEALQKADHDAAARRRQEVYGRIPRIRQIDEELAGIGPQLSRIIITDRVNGEKLSAELREKQEQLRMERAFLLTDNGFELDYMDTRYKCPLCQDTGRLKTGETCQCAENITRTEIDRYLSPDRKTTE